MKHVAAANRSGCLDPRNGAVWGTASPPIALGTYAFNERCLLLLDLPSENGRMSPAGL